MSEVEIALYQQILIGAGVVFALGWLSVAFLTAGRARARRARWRFREGSDRASGHLMKSISW